MRTTMLYAAECGFPVDDDTGKPLISGDHAQQLVDRYCPAAAVWEFVSGGIMCWESRDDHARWLSQR